MVCAFVDGELDSCDWLNGENGGGGGGSGGGDEGGGAGGGQGGGSAGNNSYSDAFASLSKVLGGFYELFMSGVAGECEKDLKAVGLDAVQIANASLRTTISNGLATFTNYASSVYGNSPAYSAAANQYKDLNVFGFFNYNPGVAAVALLNGSNIYIRARYVNDMSPEDQKGLLLHEMLHNLSGLSDDALQDRLHLSTIDASRNIGNKLKQDCFK